MGKAGNEAVLTQVGALWVPVFGQVRYCAWFNRALTATEAANLQWCGLGAVGQSSVVGSTKAGIELSHPQLSLQVDRVRAVSRDCSNFMGFSQVVPPDTRELYCFRWNPSTAPVALRGRLVGPVLRLSATPQGTISNRCGGGPP